VKGRDLRPSGPKIRAGLPPASIGGPGSTIAALRADDSRDLVAIAFRDEQSSSSALARHLSSAQRS
jgi:hypothetical protein